MICLNSRHGADHAGQHDVLAGRRVDAGGEQLRRGEDDRRLGLDVLEPAQVPAPDVALVGGDAADVVRVLLHEVGVQCGERLAHLARVLLVDAEDDGLGEAVGLLQEVGQVPRDRLRARAQRHDPLEVLGLVFVVGDRAPVAVQVAPRRPPSRRVVVRDVSEEVVRAFLLPMAGLAADQ